MISGLPLHPGRRFRTGFRRMASSRGGMISFTSPAPMTAIRSPLRSIAAVRQARSSQLPSQACALLPIRSASVWESTSERSVHAAKTGGRITRIAPLRQQRGKFRKVALETGKAVRLKNHDKTSSRIRLFQSLQGCLQFRGVMRVILHDAGIAVVEADRHSPFDSGKCENGSGNLRIGCCSGAEGLNRREGGHGIPSLETAPGGGPGTQKVDVIRNGNGLLPERLKQTVRVRSGNADKPFRPGGEDPETFKSACSPPTLQL